MLKSFFLIIAQLRNKIDFTYKFVNKNSHALACKFVCMTVLFISELCKSLNLFFERKTTEFFLMNYILLAVEFLKGFCKLYTQPQILQMEDYGY